MSKIIGLTGGIGSGKTTIAQLFIKMGIPVYFADDKAKEIMNKKEVITAVNLLFNNQVLTTDGILDRKLIKQLVFKNKELLEKLNQIVHPLVKQDFDKWVLENKNHPILIKEVAILFETNGHLGCDAVILVTAPLEERINRVMARDKVSKEVVLSIIKQQFEVEKAKKLSNFIINNVNNSKNIEHSVKNAVKFLQKLL